jgi:predicted DNA binding CopG/RHH family protein
LTSGTLKRYCVPVNILFEVFMEKKLRLVTYVSGELCEKVKREAKKLGMTESTYVRFVLLQFIKKGA